jgi:CHAT domain-containing protein/tetratricopeptide (TPR) repeat protein
MARKWRLFFYQLHTFLRVRSLTLRLVNEGRRQEAGFRGSAERSPNARERPSTSSGTQPNGGRRRVFGGSSSSHQKLFPLKGEACIGLALVILQSKFLKRWVVYGSLACLSTLLCVVLPAIANGSMPSITGTQNIATPSSSLPETHEQISSFLTNHRGAENTEEGIVRREIGRGRVFDFYGSLKTNPRGEREMSGSFQTISKGERTQTETVEQQAKNLYEAERFSEASQLLEQALQSYQKTGDIIGQAVVLSNLALSYQQLGTWEKANQAIAQAFTLLKQAPQNTPSRSGVWAQALDVLGSLQLAAGKADKAVESWEQSAKLYTQLGDSTRATRSRINQAQALQALGLYRQAIFTLNNVEIDLQSQPDSRRKAENLRSLGDALRGIGSLDCNQEKSQQSPNCARKVLEQSLDIATQVRSQPAITAANLSLGNVAWAESQIARDRGEDTPANCNEVNRKIEEAFRFYQQAMAQSVAPIQTQAQLNRLRLLVELGRSSEAQALYPQVQQQIDNLPPGRSQIYARVNLAISLRKLSTNPKNGTLTSSRTQEIDRILTVARQQAERLGDVRSQALVLEEEGQLYEQTHQLPPAQNLTRQALNLSQSINASEISYRAAWQLGRILKAQAKENEKQGNILQAGEYHEDAIAAYTEAYDTLKSVRGDLIAASSDIQFSFRESVEPVYRELVDLLLQPSFREIVPTQEKQESLKQSQEKQKNHKQEKLKKAREVLEALQVAELQNYFQQACEDIKLELDRVVDRGEQQGEKAAVIYPIILSDRLEVILKLPNQELYQYPPVRLSKDEIQKTLDEFQNNLRDEYKFRAVRESGQEVYNWLIKPIRDRLESSGVETLIFIQDGPLRMIPMSALYDGNQFLVENYTVVLVLGLEVRDPTPLNRSQMKVLAASLTDPPKGFEQYAKLPNVNPELDEIKQAGVSVSSIQDKNFTKEAFNKKLNQDSFQVVHLATHGQFGADPNSTYILAADGEIKLNQLDEMFRTLRGSQAKAIDLLILSACRTATGNDRAVLGIAGTAVRAGARSAIAGLWSLADSSSVEFTQTLYQNLGKPKVTRAEALRQAQLALLYHRNYFHPRYWAPYVLIGSWL